MSKRQKKNQSAENGADNATEVAVIENAEEIVASNDDAGEIETTAEAEVDAEVLAALAADDASTTTSEAEPEITVDDVEDPTDDEVLAAIDAAKPARKSGSKGPKAPPAIMRDFTAVAMIDEATLKANLDGINAKKVREKAENLIAAVQSGKKLSRYTADAVKHLKAQGRVSGKSLADMFQAEGLGLGTARAQSQQMTALFKAVGLAAPEAGSRDLVLQDNNLADELVKLAA